MKVFTVNQATQAYVINKVVASDSLKNAGDACFFETTEGDLYLKIVNALGEVERTDLIPYDNIMYATTKKISAPKLHTYKIVLTDNPVSGQDYVLNVEVGNYIGVSPEDSKYWKFGSVRATANMTKETFYKAMAESLKRNMSREAVQFMEIEATADSLNITEVEPDWILGLKQRKVLTLNPIPGVIEVDGIETQWAVTPNSKEGRTAGLVTVAKTLTNGPESADLEWFFHGERGDNYRDVRAGWSGIDTKYLVDPTKEYGVIDVHYYFAGTCEDVQRSEKDILLIVPMNLGTMPADAPMNYSQYNAYNYLKNYFTGKEESGDENRV